MFKINNLYTVNSVISKITLRVNKNMFQYPILKSNDLIVHISNPMINDISIIDDTSCNDSTIDKSHYKKVLINSKINVSIALYKNKKENDNLDNLNSLDLYKSESIQISIDNCEFCIRKDYPELTIYDFLVSVYSNEYIINPIDISENFYIYELNIEAKLDLAPLITIPPENSNLIKMLNYTLSKDENNTEFTHGELSSLNILYYANDSNLDFSIFKYFINLDRLYLSYNYFDSLPKYFENLSKLSNLSYLHLAENNLSSLPENFANLINLEELYLYGNNLESLCDDFGQLINLSSLYIYNNHLESLPDSFCNLSNLTTLYMEDNKISSLPQNFAKLINLSSLSISYNNISYLPDGFCNLSNLVELFLSNNNLCSLPSNFNNLNNLIYLDLDYNNFCTFPKIICNLSNLVCLSICGNKLNTIPKKLNQLNQLVYLFLDENKFTALPSIIKNLDNLEMITLDKNQISNLSVLKNKNIRISAKKQEIYYGRLKEENNNYKLDLSFLRDEEDKIPFIFNISNLGHLEVEDGNTFIYWNLEEKYNSVFFEFDNHPDLDNFKFSGTVTITLE